MSNTATQTDWASPETICLAHQTPGDSIMPAYYDPARKTYWIQNERSGWMEVSETSLGLKQASGDWEKTGFAFCGDHGRFRL